MVKELKSFLFAIDVLDFVVVKICTESEDLLEIKRKTFFFSFKILLTVHILISLEKFYGIMKAFKELKLRVKFTLS